MSGENQTPAYQLFNKEGKTVNFEDISKKLAEADIVLFGELHNNPICHWLQLRTTKKLFEAHGENLILAAEMFEKDDQLILNEYLKGKIQEKHLESEAKLWNNYQTDYAPLVNFAKDNKLKFIGSNIPRRYASLVSREGLEGLESLDKEAKKLIAPLPVKVDLALPGYKNMLEMMGTHGGNAQAENFAKAQAIKDATMANSILENMDKNQHTLHFNGAYHSNNFEGIMWYLQQAKPKLKIVTISSVEQESVESLEEKNLQLADYIIVIPSDMTKTY
ncbi:ChaN family lipoprotein [Chondrinema litorale]|uniref:ChaN family lipoprotein n=1 Tax=Chondrinema litorale TaxID=2994555 RepID=UPI0025439550|nr:ChaN family lipoprotein [Chondrinema litorale]UZR92755.1 ChaN family lipoprotein [Chondrinema litorale]